MKNDYKRTDFKEIKENNSKHYFIRIQKQWVEVSFEVFKVYKSSYEKIYYENKRDYDKVFYFENLDLAFPYLNDMEISNQTEIIYKHDLIKKMMKIVSNLSK